MPRPSADKPSKTRNGKLKIELPFEDALRAAVETKFEPAKPRPARRKTKTK